MNEAIRAAAALLSGGPDALSRTGGNSTITRNPPDIDLKEQVAGHSPILPTVGHHDAGGGRGFRASSIHRQSVDTFIRAMETRDFERRLERLEAADTDSSLIEWLAWYADAATARSSRWPAEGGI